MEFESVLLTLLLVVIAAVAFHWYFAKLVAVYFDNKRKSQLQLLVELEKGVTDGEPCEQESERRQVEVA